MRVYVVDNGGQWTHREWRVLKYLGVETEIIPNTTPWDDIRDLDGLVLSGGAPRIGLEDSLGEIGTYLDEADYPIMGICAGHQFMATHFGGETAPGETPEFGKTKLVLDGDGGRLLAGLPEESTVWESHNDEVVRVPDGFRVLGHSKDCPVQAMEHETRDLYGVQFHPEVDHTEHGERIFQNFLDACKD